MRVGDDVWLDARALGLHKWKSGSWECGPRVRLRARRRKRGRLLEMSRMQLREQYECARANGTGLRDNGGRRRGGIVILSRMASIYPRHASIEKPACLNVSVSPWARNVTSARIHSSFDGRSYLSCHEEKGFFVSHRDVENWSIELELFFNSKCRYVGIVFESLIRFA